MNSRSLSGYAAIAALTVLSGCAAAPPTMHQTDPAHSQAWNLTRAAEYETLKDVPHEKVEQRVDTGGASLGGTLAAGGLGFLSNPNGLSLGGNVGLNMLTNMLLGGDIPKAGGTNIVAWIPKTEAATNDEAIVQANERVMQLMMEQLRDMALPAPYTWKQLKLWDAFNYGYDGAIYADLAGGECDQDNYTCRVQVLSRPTGKADEVNDAIAPESLGGYPAWRVETGVSYYFYDRSAWTREKVARIPLLRALYEISGELPRNYFIYVAPHRTPFKKDESSYALFPAPMVLHEGQALYFIEPTPGA